MINHAAGAKEISEIISAELTNNGRLAGLAYNVVNVDFNTLLNALYTPDLKNPTYTAFSLATGFTPVIDPYYEFHSSQIGAQNLDRVNDPAADEIMLKMNMTADLVKKLITPKTKVIVPVHYAGVACDMNKVIDLVERYNLLVVEDAAQSVDSYYKPSLDVVPFKALGSIGHLGCFSFHETKNIVII